MKDDNGITKKTFHLHTSTLRRVTSIKKFTLNKKVTDDELFLLLIESFMYLRDHNINWLAYTDDIANDRVDIKEYMVYTKKPLSIYR